MIAVIQAGGKGTRLRPYTFVVPKPLMPVGDMPVLEILLRWLRRGQKSIITAGYLGHLIRALAIVMSTNLTWTYLAKSPNPWEHGGLLIEPLLKRTFLSINGDLITDLNLREFCLPGSGLIM
jgi:mannose-1-phosphate guanylyltransferase